MLSIVMLVEVVNPVINNMTEAAIESIVETTEGRWELVCYVHGETPLELSRKYGNVTIFHNLEQLSIAEGYNKAVKLANYDTLCIVHNDIILPGYGWNTTLTRVAELGGIAFPMVDESGGQCEQRGVAKTEPWQTSSSCYMVSRKVWDEIGGLDERFEGMHGEDIDFFKSCEKAGHKLVRCDPWVIHHRGVSRSFVPDRANKPFFKNWVKYNDKHGLDPNENTLPRLSETPEFTFQHLGDMSND